MKLYLQGKYYHVYNRGCNRLPIFFSDENYRFLIQKFIDTIGKYGIEISAYCLMPNHYHLLVRQNSDISISKWLKTVFNGYSQAINKQENRKGTIFEGRARNKEITNESHLMHLIRYIHYNPVQAGLVSKAEKWEFSNYPDWIGIRKNKLFNNRLLLQYFENHERYKRFFGDYENSEKIAIEFRSIFFDAE